MMSVFTPECMKARSVRFIGKQALLVAFLSLIGLNLMGQSTTTTQISTTGGGSWVAPAGVTKIKVEVWGGGGGGGGAVGAVNNGGGGGAGGAYTFDNISTINPGNTYYYNVGIAGTASSGNNGVAGGDSWFNSINSSVNPLVIAKGGAGGNANNGAGGAGVTTGSVPLANALRGGHGVAGTSSLGGAGGGGAGSSGSGGDASGFTAGTGTSNFGGTGGTGRDNTNAAGNAASSTLPSNPSYGGGGGGALRTGGGAKSGGAGRQGYMQITYTAPPTITNFTPTSICPGNAVSVTLTGTNFTNASSVTLNGTSISFVVNSATSITASVPAAGVTSGVFRVTNDGNYGESSSSFQVGGPDVSPFSITATDVLQGDKSTVTISAADLANGTYTISYSYSGTNMGSSTANVTFASGAGSFTTNEMANSGATTITVTQVTTTGSAICSSVTNASDAISVTTVGTCISIASNNWNQSSTWDCGGGVNRVPTSSDNVIIAEGFSVAINPSVDPIHDFTIESNGSLTDNSGTPDLVVTGDFTLDGTISASSTEVALTGVDKIIDGLGNITAISGSVTVTNNKTIVDAANLFLSSGMILSSNTTITNQGEITLSGNITGTSNSSIWTNDVNSTLNIGGTGLNSDGGTSTSGAYTLKSIFPVTNSGILNASASGNTVHYFNSTANDFDIVIPSSTYYNLSFSGSNGTRSVPSGSTIEVTNDFTISTSNGAVSAGSNGTLIIGGDWINTSSSAGSFTQGSSGTVIFNGTGNQHLTASSLASGEGFGNLTINKAGGSLTFNSDVFVEYALTMTSGNILVAINKVFTLGSSVSTLGTLNRTSGTVIGKFKRYIASASGSTLFPVGTSTYYRPASISWTSGAFTTGGSIIAEFVESFPGNTGLDPALTDGAVTIYNTFRDGYWTLQGANSFAIGTANFTLNLTGTGFTGFSVVDDETRMVTGTGTPISWSLSGTHVTYAGSYLVSRSGLNNISTANVQGFAFGDNTPCPSTYPVITITGDANICAGEENSAYTVSSPTPTSTYFWSVLGDVSTSITGAGIISVVSGSAIVTGSSTSFGTELAVGNTLATTSGEIIGTIGGITDNLTLTLDLPASRTYTNISYKTLDFTATGTTSVGGSDVITTNWDTSNPVAGYVEVYETDEDGCSGETKRYAVNVQSIAPGSVTGGTEVPNNNVTLGSVDQRKLETYTTTAQSYYTAYTWEVTGGEIVSGGASVGTTVTNTVGVKTTEVGTLSVTSGSTAVTGAGGSLFTGFRAGQILYTAANVQIGTIASISSNTSLTLSVGASTTYTNISGFQTGGMENTIAVKWGEAGIGTVRVKGTTECDDSEFSDELDVEIYNLIYSVSGGTWVTNSIWSCNCTPTSLDNVLVSSGHSVTLTAADGFAKNLIIAGTLSGTSGRDMTISGHLTMNGGTFGNGAAGGLYLISGSTVNPEIDGTGTINPTTTGINVQSDRIFTSGANITTGTGALNISAGVKVTNHGTVTLGTGGVVGADGTSEWVNEASSTLNVAGPLLATGVLTASADGNTVLYNNTATQNIKSPATSYYNLSLSAAGEKTAPASLTIGGNFVNSGTAVTANGTGFNHNGGSVFFAGVDTVSGTSTTTFNNVTISGTLTAPTAMNVAGTFTNNGTFTHSNGTVTLNGAAQNITGTNPTTFYNLTLAGTANSIKTFSLVTTAASNLTLTGVRANLSTLTHGANTLTFNGLNQPAGSYGSSISPATFQNNTFFDVAANGILNAASSTYYSIADGPWTTNATWSFNSNGAAVGVGFFPLATDYVFIERGFNVTLTADAECASLDFTTNAASSLTHNGFTLDVTNDITIPRVATGTNSMNVGTGSLTASNIAFTNVSGTTGHEILISTGTVDVSGNITSDASSTSPLIALSSTGTLQLGGTIFPTTGGSLTTVVGSTVEYDGANQMVQAHPYNGHLALSNSGTKTLLSGTTNIGGNLSLSGSAVSATVTGLTIGGNLNIGDGTEFTNGAHALSVGGATNIGASGAELVIASSTGSKQFTGLVTVASGGTWNNSGNAAATFRGGITNSGIFTAGSGVHTFDTNDQQLTGTFSIPNVTVSGAGIELTNNNNLTVSTALSGTGELTQATNATLNLGGSSSIATLNASNSGNTVNYNGSADQTIKVPSSSQYVNLSFNGTAGVAIAPASTLNVSGNWINNGAGTSGSFTGFNPNGGTIVFNGATNAISGTSITSFYNLTNATSTSLTSSSGVINIGNDFANTGTGAFLPNGGEVVFNGTTQSITGLSTNFHDLTLNTGSNLTVNVPVTSTGTLLNNGTFSPGANLVSVTDLQNEGTFNAPTTTLTVLGNFDNNDTYNPLGGTVSFEGTTIVSGATTPTSLHHVILDGTSLTLSATPEIHVTGDVTFTNGIFNAGTSSVVLNGTATQTLDVGGAVFHNLETSKPSGEVLLNSNLGVSGLLELTSGNVNFSDDQLTLSGTILSADADDRRLVANENSTLVVSGSGNFGSLYFDALGNTLGVLAIDRAATGTHITLGNPLTVETALNLTEGELENGVNLTLTNGAMINRTADGFLNTALTSGVYNITYLDGAIPATYPTDVELVNGLVGNIHIDNTVGNVELGGSFNLHGIMTFGDDGSFDAGSNQLTVKSTSDTEGGIIGEIKSGTFSGTINVERFMGAEGRVNRYISSPVTGTTVADIDNEFPLVRNLIQHYQEWRPGNQNIGYRNEGLTHTLVSGRGYLIFPETAAIGDTDQTWSVNGPLTLNSNQGDVALPVFYTDTFGTDDEDGWNLVGNPYPAPITWNADLTDWTSNNIDPVIYITDMGTGSFVDYDVAEDPDPIIASGQAFWVKANAAAPSLTVKEAAKTTTNGEFFRKGNSTDWNGLNIEISSGAAKDKSSIRIKPEASLEYEKGVDYFKLEGLFVSVGVLSADGKQLVRSFINEIGESEIYLAVSSLDGGEQKISFTKNGNWNEYDGLYLVDKVLANAHKITDGPYTFTSTANYSSRDRFMLTANPQALLEKTVLINVYPNPTSNKVNISLVSDNMVTVAITDSNGKSIATGVLESKGRTQSGAFDLSNAASGIYFVKVFAGDQIHVRKIIKE